MKSIYHDVQKSITHELGGPCQKSTRRKLNVITFSRSIGYSLALLILLLGSQASFATPIGNLINPDGWILQDGGAEQNLNAYVQNGNLYLSNSGVFGQVNGQPGIIVPDFTQTINTTPGQSYTFQFDVNSDGAGQNLLLFSTANSGVEAILYLARNIPQESGVAYSFTETVTSSSTYIAFSGGAPDSSLFITNISATAAVPEASTLLSTSGLICLGIYYTVLLIKHARKHNRDDSAAS